MATYGSLATFLADLGRDPDLLKQYNRSERDARELMSRAGLSDAQQNALLGRDVTAIHTQLLAENGDDQSFVVPAGPVMTAETISNSQYRDFPFPVMFFQAQPSEHGGGGSSMALAGGPMPTMAARPPKRVRGPAGGKKKTTKSRKTTKARKTAGSRRSGRSRKGTSRKK